MSAKIIVHKFEEESNYKTLQITIGGNDQDLSDIKFSNWQDGKTEMKKKEKEQHWLSCMWLKTCYQFSLPKLLLCNACDRKFRNYDQLYNHRYKLGHFMPKISVENNCAYPTLVYQCEICGQWFSTIAQLRVHRSQYHPQFDNGTSYNVDTSSATE
ncbi:uncharacterized protein LOC123876127 isoform X2 [Maniola jurtina]|uniref:uncharacterized protein LOC123876127 isoform X2 n=1 Tax=Maniola jurtina TaxID=191418 RepID=UPI001E689C77|nr:uncharacterized protein LOC123876127 isoform X2 [Maniola jurtina]